MTIITTFSPPEIETWPGRNVLFGSLIGAIMLVPPALARSVAQPPTLVASLGRAFWHVVRQLPGPHLSPTPPASGRALGPAVLQVMTVGLVDWTMILFRRCLIFLRIITWFIRLLLGFWSLNGVFLDCFNPTNLLLLCGSLFTTLSGSGFLRDPGCFEPFLILILTLSTTS